MEPQTWHLIQSRIIQMDTGIRGFLVRHALFLQEEQSEIHRKAATFGANERGRGREKLLTCLEVCDDRRWTSPRRFYRKQAIKSSSNKEPSGGRDASSHQPNPVLVLCSVHIEMIKRCANTCISHHLINYILCSSTESSNAVSWRRLSKGHDRTPLIPCSNHCCGPSQVGEGASQDHRPPVWSQECYYPALALWG